MVEASPGPAATLGNFDAVERQCLVMYVYIIGYVGLCIGYKDPLPWTVTIVPWFESHPHVTANHEWISECWTLSHGCFQDSAFSIIAALPDVTRNRYGIDTNRAYYRKARQKYLTQPSAAVIERLLARP